MKDTTFRVGMLVVLNFESKDPTVIEWTKERENYYGGVFKVSAIVDKWLVLEWVVDNLYRAKPGDVVHFGSCGDAKVSSAFFRPL